MLTPSNLLKTPHKCEIEEISKCPELSDIENGLTGHFKINVSKLIWLLCNAVF